MHTNFFRTLIHPHWPALFGMALLLSLPCCRPTGPVAQSAVLSAPGGQVRVHVFVRADGAPAYTLHHGDDLVVDTSTLGFTLKDAPPMRTGFEVIGMAQAEADDTWEAVWGERRQIRNHYRELTLQLREQAPPHRLMNLVFRAYDEGIGFRYILPEQPGIAASFTIMEEHSQFKFTADHEAWWIPADHDSYEYLHEHTPLSGMDATHYAAENERVDRLIRNFRACNTPITLKTAKGLHLSLHEAQQLDYPDMTLALADDNRTLVSELVPWADGDRVKATLPMRTPWRTISLSTWAGGLVESDLILNLNDPCVLDDLSFVEPMTYTGIWWEMHIGKTTWGREAPEGSWSNTGGSRHGATTENAKRYIDFNAQHGIRGLLIEGWNMGWEYWGIDTVGFFDFVTPYPDFDMEEVARYAREKGVALIGHHETAGDVTNYEQRLEKAFQYYQDLGIKAVKTGYAGQIRPKGERHHGQYMIRHFQKVAETAARYGIAINAHEASKDTGLRRTWPNFMTRECLRGTEYDAWSEGNPPAHTVTLPFTRFLGGPGDYTPGIFDVLYTQYRKQERVRTTVAKQLALLVTLYSPHQMAADLPENYEGKPAFQFIQNLTADWADSKVLHAEIGEYFTVARKAHGRDDWFLGSTTNEQPRTLDTPLHFLQPGLTYVATLYTDGLNAHWDTNPHPVSIEQQKVTRGTVLRLQLAPGGGAAIHFVPER